MNGLAVVVAVLLSCALPAAAQQPRTAPQSATPAKEMFVQYCASCHGLSGKGDGPAGSSLKTRPPDLTTLTRRSGGRFPEMRVLGAIKAGPSVSAHGSETMPAWGPIFLEVTGAATESEVQLKIYNLMEYIKTLQVN